ncbi:MAG: ABC transporter permease [Vicinamibacterales bacterium]
MSTLLQDLRLAVRLLHRRPAFTITAVLTLAIGMGVNAVAFSVVNGLLFKAFGGKTAPGVGRIATLPAGNESGYASLQEYQRFVEATGGSLEVAAEGRSSASWRHDGTTETAWVLDVSANYFSMLTLQPVAGQLRVADVAGASPSVVIGERFWREKLSSASLAGLTLRLNGIDVSVSGVVPGSFTGPAGLYSPDVWLPLDGLQPVGSSPALRNRDARWLFLLGRLQPQATIPQIQGQLDTAVQSMARDWPATHKDRAARFRMLGEGNEEIHGLSAVAGIALGIIGLVLLLACFNVANLLLARAVERERDMGIRAALGASPGRLMRLVITEGLVIAAMAGALALILAWWTQALVGSFAIPIEMPQHIDVTPDRRVVGFIMTLTAIAGVLPGLWPALAAGRVNVSRVLGSQGANAAGGRPSPLRRWLVGAQIAGSTAFIAVAALLLQSYGRLSMADQGFAREHLLTAEFDAGSHGYAPDRAARYVEALLARVRTLPGVVDAAVADRAPFFIGYDRQTAVWPAAGACSEDTCLKYPTLSVGAGYFRTMGIALVEGREFHTGPTAAEVVINQSFARKHWPAGGGVGETIRIGIAGTTRTVVGVTATTHIRGLDREQPTLFLPLEPEHYAGGLTVVAQTTPAPALLVRPLRDAATSVDPVIAMSAVKTMEERMAVQLWPFRTLSWMFSICGTLAAILATVGLAGVIIHAVNSRMREFGVRLSIGATPRHLVVDVLRGSAALLVPGLVTGLILAAVAARLTQAVFVGVDVLDPAVYLGVAVLQSVVVILACLGPALSAARVDPLKAMRAE